MFKLCVRIVINLCENGVRKILNKGIYGLMIRNLYNYYD